MSDNAKINKLEGKINEIMGRTTYSSTPAWQQEVAEMRLQVEALRAGKDVERQEYKRLTVDPQGMLVFSESPNAADDMPTDDHGEAEHHDVAYIAIFMGLFFFTVLEWKCAAWFGIHGLTLWGILGVMALIKALMVALYFMHLKFERKTVYILMILPIVLILVMVGLLVPDSHQHTLQYLSRMVGN